MLNQSSTSISHKDIAARQQAGSSIFPWQKSDQPQSRQSMVSMETPRKRCGGGGSSLWDAHDETPIKPSQQMSSSAVAQSPAGSSDQMNQLKALNQGEQVTVIPQTIVSQTWFCKLSQILANDEPQMMKNLMMSITLDGPVTVGLGWFVLG